MRFSVASTALAVILQMAGCAYKSAPEDPGARQPLRARYACTGGENFVAEFSVDRKSVRIKPATGAALALPATPAGSGFRYADARHELRGKGSEAMWTVGRRAPLRCHLVP